MPDSIISLRNVGLWYEKGKPMEVKALKGVTLDIERGDYVAFFGSSGCGKTTMLYAISGIDHFQEGQITINNKDISTLTNQELAIFRQTGIGIVFQQFNLVPSLTVLKNVALPMLFVGISSEKADSEAAKLLDRLNLSEYAHRYPFELSGGQQQRVGIARALANDPPIIIADEPLGNLDSVNAKKVLEFLKELNEKDGRTIIMVTHEAWSLRDVKTIYHMKDGSITEIEHISPKTLNDSITSHLNKQLSSVSEPSTTPIVVPPSQVKKEDTKINNIGDFDDVLGDDIASHQIANSQLSGYSLDEIDRFENFVKNRFFNIIDKNEFNKLMVKPFKENGLGLRGKKAEKVSSHVEDVIERRKNMRALRRLMSKNPETDISAEIQNLRNWMVDGYTRELTSDELKSIDQIVADRIRNYISKDKVVELLGLTKNKSGAGLSFRASQIFAEKLELVLEGILVNNNVQQEVKQESSDLKKI
ncbi:MAG: ABC transporter ATP-binding protein [Candidatus Nomurabacteria bacterium]|nr:ABC transporter ATP-binding protein [Candidatus Nomurabacteria bacterium]